MRTGFRNPVLTFVAAGVLLAAAQSGVRAQHGHEHDEAGRTSPTTVEDGVEHDTGSGSSSAHSADGGVDYNQPPMAPNRAMLELFVFTLLLFGGFVFVARQFVWTPLIDGLNSREERVRHAYAQAESMKAEVQRLIHEHEAQIAATYEQVRSIVAESRQEADRVKGEVTSAAALEAQSQQEQAVAEIERAKEQALAELSNAAERYSSLATDHVLGYSLSNR